MWAELLLPLDGIGVVYQTGCLVVCRHYGWYAPPGAWYLWEGPWGGAMGGPGEGRGRSLWAGGRGCAKDLGPRGSTHSSVNHDGAFRENAGCSLPLMVEIAMNSQKKASDVALPNRQCVHDV